MRLQSKDYLFVLVQFVLFGLFLLEIQALVTITPRWIRLSGIPIFIAGLVICGIAVLQLNRNLSPFPSPKSGSHLITNGVFRLVRHPIYSGILLGLLGGSLYYQSLYKMAISTLLMALFYFKTTYEEERLAAAFKDYHSYKAKTKRFVPFLF